MYQQKRISNILHEWTIHFYDEEIEKAMIEKNRVELPTS
jgi:hypothetical protein